jgi:hypothetical protein
MCNRVSSRANTVCSFNLCMCRQDTLSNIARSRGSPGVCYGKGCTWCKGLLPRSTQCMEIHKACKRNLENQNILQDKSSCIDRCRSSSLYFLPSYQYHSLCKSLVFLCIHRSSQGSLGRSKPYYSESHQSRTHHLQ